MTKENDLDAYKMLKTQKGVRAGEHHPVTFHRGKTYELDASLADQFIELGIVDLARKPKELSVARHEDGDLGVAKYEDSLDEDPAVLRHGELSPEEIHAINDRHHEGDDEDDAGAGETTGKKAKKAAPENK